VELSDGQATSDAVEQQLQAARDEASALQQQLVDVRQHAQEQVKELRASNAALHVSTSNKLHQCNCPLQESLPVHRHVVVPGYVQSCAIAYTPADVSASCH
jgi:hypothetical protein